MATKKAVKKAAKGGAKPQPTAAEKRAAGLKLLLDAYIKLANRPALLLGAQRLDAAYRAGGGSSGGEARKGPAGEEGD